MFFTIFNLLLIVCGLLPRVQSHTKTVKWLYKTLKFYRIGFLTTFQNETRIKVTRFEGIIQVFNKYMVSHWLLNRKYNFKKYYLIKTLTLPRCSWMAIIKLTIHETCFNLLLNAYIRSYSIGLYQNSLRIKAFKVLLKNICLLYTVNCVGSHRTNLPKLKNTKIHKNLHLYLSLL